MKGNISLYLYNGPVIIHRVGDVCESVRREGGRREGGGVVLMVADGQQMEDSELVGGYSPGMVRWQCLASRFRTKVWVDCNQL